MGNKKVTKIDATIKIASFDGGIIKKRRVAAYARVSTAAEEQETSLAAQRDYYEQYIKENKEWEFVGIYYDDGISGLSFRNRDGFNRMVNDALDGKIDLILTKSLSRFARNTVDTLTTIRKLKAAKKITVKGIMVHSTGANNPWLKRYVGPDDGRLGKNQYNNHWNTYHPGGREVCVHGFIGKLADGTVATYQTLPWDHRGWHAGGSANNTHIGFEICEDGLTDATYFKKVYQEAIDLCVYLCKEYGLTEKNIICHSEGYKQGVASNHGDVMHWFPKHGKSMDTFRAEVAAKLKSETPTAGKPTTSTTTVASEINVGAKVEIKAAAEKYNPTTSNIPAWVKNDYYHIVTQTTYKGKPVVKGGKTCVLLGKKIKKSGGDEVAGINTWVAIDNLNVVTGAVKVEETYRIHTVVHGDTLWGIAKKYLGDGNRYPEIVKLNGLKSNVIYSGNKLKIPN